MFVNFSYFCFLIKFLMNNTLRIILKVLIVITWVLMVVWYTSFLLTLVQAYCKYGNIPVGQISYPSQMFLICLVMGFYNFIVLIFMGFPLNLWNMIHEFKLKKFSTLMFSACYIFLAVVFIITSGRISIDWRPSFFQQFLVWLHIKEILYLCTLLILIEL